MPGRDQLEGAVQSYFEVYGDAGPISISHALRMVRRSLTTSLNDEALIGIIATQALARGLVVELDHVKVSADQAATARKPLA